MIAPSRQVLLDCLFLGTGERDVFGATDSDNGYSTRKAWLATRPSLPPLLFLAGFTWLGDALAIEVLCGSSLEMAHLAFICGFGIAAIAFGILASGGTMGGCVALGIALGCALGASHTCAVMSGQAQLLATKAPLVVCAVQDSRPASYGSTFLARAENGALVRIVDTRGERTLVGDRFNATATWKAPTGVSARESWRKGISAVSVSARLEVFDQDLVFQPLYTLRRKAIQQIKERSEDLAAFTGIECDEAAMMLSAIVLGYAADLYDSELYQTVKVDGLAHLVAVSGAHLAIVCGLLGAALRRASLPRSIAICMQVLFLGGYLVLTGAPTSAIRAAIMALLGFGAYFEARRSYALGGLSCCIVGMLALDPAAAFSLSLLLSVGATAGIILFSGYFTNAIYALFHVPSGLAVDSMALTLAATLFTAVPSALLFSQISLIAPISNVIITPAFPIICLGGLLCVVSDALIGGVFAFPLDLLLAVSQLLCAGLRVLADIPHAACPVYLSEALAIPLAVLPAALLWFCWPYPSARSACSALGIVLGVACALGATTCMRPDSITMLDIGQGDAILVQSAGRALLIDTGTEDALLMRGLAACGVQDLDAVLITHPDDDHCGSLAALRGTVGVGEVLVADDLLGEEESHCATLREEAYKLVGEDALVGLEVGDTIVCGRMRMLVVGPDAYHDSGGNADSLVIVLEYDAEGDGSADVTGLFCGDAESEQIGRYIDDGRIGDVDIYKVGHHGSRAAVDEHMLKVLNPEVSLVSVGAYNRYGHPAPETVELLQREGSRVYRTDEQGAITCILQKDGIHIQTQR